MLRTFRETLVPTRKRENRFDRILSALAAANGMEIHDLAADLRVSEMTVRRDLEELAAQGKVRFLHAGAVPAGGREAAAAPTAAHVEKMRIGGKAASLVEAGDIIFVDSGVTTEWMVRSLPLDMPLTIVCCALNILLEAGRGTQRSLIFAGGTQRAGSQVFESPEAVSLLRRHRVTKAFLSAGGISDPLGVTCSDPAEAELKKAAVAMSQVRILLADARKFGRVRPAWFADLGDVDAVVTDPGISLEYVEILRTRGIALHVV
jgi:DeoR family transcriptional regulator, deoxyribose operon repressor